MAISWDIARRVMLTQADLFSSDDQASDENCMQAILQPNQIHIACHCIKGFFWGLKWAEHFGIRGGYASNRSFHQIFLIEDEHILGVFDDLNPLATSNEDTSVHPPASLEKLIELYQQKLGDFKTLLVLEKSNRRLASSEVQGRQSRFLLDVLYPALAGIQAKSGKPYERYYWKKVMLMATHQTKEPEPLNKIADCCKVTVRQPDKRLLAAIYHNSRAVNKLLLQATLLRYFYNADSPFNLNLESARVMSSVR